MTTGTELRDARERLGLSRQQISSATKIKLPKIVALEEDAFDRLPQGIYLAGIAAACAREVGLDVDPFVRRVLAEAAPPRPITLQDIAAARPPNEFSAPRLSLTPLRGMLAFGFVPVVLVIVTLGARFYQFESVPDPHAGTRMPEKTEHTTPRVALDLSQAFPVATGTSHAEAVGEPDPGQTTLVDPTGLAASESPLEPIAAQAAAGRPDAAMELRPFVEVSDIDGAWTFATLVQSSSVRMFEGLRLGYRLELRQKDGRIEGTGRKVSENGVILVGGLRTPITVQGTLDHGRLTLTFGEQGARRHSTGTFELVLQDRGLLRGVFSSNAARSAGVVEARRL